MILQAAEMAKEKDADAVTKWLSDESGLYRMYKEDNSIEGQSKASNVEELLNSIAQFIEDRHGEYEEEMRENGSLAPDAVLSPEDYPQVPLADFLEDISLLSAVDVSDDEETSNRVSLMTAHSAKGLEFPYVFVSGMEENLFPSGSMLASESEIEEERRLFYVAITRAMKAVTLTFATTRMRNGKHESNAPSRFLREIAPQYLVNPLRKRRCTPIRSTPSMNPASDSAAVPSGSRLPLSHRPAGSVPSPVLRCGFPVPSRTP